MQIMNNRPTKERILDAAEELMLDKGFHSVGLKQILDTVNVPKGSFYHYFESKEQFGVEMLKHYMEDSTGRKREMLSQQAEIADPIQRLFTYLDGWVINTAKIAGKFPCLVLKLASEVTDLSEPMRQELEKGFDDWINLFQVVLDEAVEKDLLSNEIGTQETAQLMQDLLNGATQRSVINHDEEPIRRAVEFIKAHIRAMMI